MASATIFKGFNNPLENKSLILLTKDIKEGKYKEEVEKVMALAAAGDREAADKCKRSLLAFTTSATFEGGRKVEYLVQYSGFIILDLDKLTPEQYTLAFGKASAISYTFCCFRSPGGNGLKILIEVTSTQEHHEQAYKQVADYYESQIGLSIDRSGKDITRLCFVSYDPEAYRNINSEKFPVAVINPIAKTIVEAPQINHSDTQEEPNPFALAFDMQIKFTNQKLQYEHSNRNNFIYLLASNCNRGGIPELDTLQLCYQNYDLNASEIKQSVHSAYQHHSDEFAKFADVAKLQNENSNSKDNKEAESEDYLKNTPFIKEALYQQMPEIIKQGALAFIDFRERDVFLTGALGILSGCLPGVKGIYAQQEVFPNIFTFAIAPAASGKGALKFAKQLADEYHAQVLNNSKEADTKYQQEEASYKMKVKTAKKSEPVTEDPPAKPPFKVVFIPANTSYAKILSHMEHNEGFGIICETEADTIGNVFKQEWGSYSDMLRKSFHHERLSSSRKTNNEFIEVHTPCLSIALSGTPSQVTGLIASAEDGLFSRFIFYAFKVEQIWKDVSPYGSQVNLTKHFESLSLQVYELVKFLKQSETWVTLSPYQWQQLNHQCSVWLKDITTFTSEDAASIVKRLGLVLFRICMLFSALRKFENGDASLTVECTDVDFSIALQLVETFLHHSILMFNNLPKQQGNTDFENGDYKRKFFEALPQNFTRGEAVELGKKHKLSIRLVDELLKNATPSLLAKIKTGHYQKN